MDSEKFQWSCWLFNEGPLKQECDQRNIPVTLFPSSTTRTPWGLKKITSNLQQLSPDLIYLHASRLIALIARQLKIPCLERINMTRRHEIEGWCRYAILDRWFSNANSHLLAVSQAIKDQLVSRGLSQEKIEVIHNFVDVDRFYHPHLKKNCQKELQIPENSFVITNIGRFVLQKAPADFLRILKNLVDKNIAVYGLLVGEGPLEEALKKESHSLGLGAYLKILPFQNSIEKIYAASDCLVHTAHWEPLANVLLEAGAAGLPIIATDVDGTREVLRGDKGDRLYLPGDEAQATQHVLSLIQNPPPHKNCQDKINWIRKEFSPEKKKQEYEKLFTFLIQSKSSQ